MDRLGIILAIPAGFDLEKNAPQIEAVISALTDFNIACLRLISAGLKREELIKRGDILREIGHGRDISVIIDDQFSIARDIGLDGVHLTNADAKALREARKALGKDAIIGVFAGASKHDGMVVGEIGVDYVSFGPLQDRGFDEEIARGDIFSWWAEMIEIPLVAEGVMARASLEEIEPFVDFIALGDEVFGEENPVDAVKALLAGI